MDEISGDTDEFKGVRESINKELNAKYQAVERCLSFRNKSNVDTVRELAATTEDLCRKLLSMLIKLARLLTIGQLIQSGKINKSSIRIYMNGLHLLPKHQSLL